MPLYRYHAVTSTGQILRGEREGPDQTAVIGWIQACGHLPVSADPVRGGLRPLRLHAERTPARIARRELGPLTRELSALLNAGMALDRALQVIVDVSHDPGVRRIAAAMQEAVRGGSPLSSAMQAQPRTFSRFHVSMIAAAEAGGALHAGLASVADYEERSKALRDSVLSALIYPCILVFVSAASLLVILAYVVPQFSQLFAGAGRALPFSTQLVLGAADGLLRYWWLLAAGAAAALALLRLEIASSAGRRRWDRLLLRLPIVGGLVQRVQMARFSRALGTLLASGVSLLASLSIVREILSSQALADAVGHTADAVREGRSLAATLIATGLFPALGLQMIKVGEETGRLDEMLLRVADIYDREVVGATQRLLALLEPALIVGLGLVIGGVIMSILLAIVTLNDLPL